MRIALQYFIAVVLAAWGIAALRMGLRRQEQASSEWAALGIYAVNVTVAIVLPAVTLMASTPSNLTTKHLVGTLAVFFLPLVSFAFARKANLRRGR